jgi:hypothetical protein
VQVRTGDPLGKKAKEVFKDTLFLALSRLTRFTDREQSKRQTGLAKLFREGVFARGLVVNIAWLQTTGGCVLC